MRVACIDIYNSHRFIYEHFDSDQFSGVSHSRYFIPCTIHYTTTYFLDLCGVDCVHRKRENKPLTATGKFNIVSQIVRLSIRNYLLHRMLYVFGAGTKRRKLRIQYVMLMQGNLMCSISKSNFEFEITLGNIMIGCQLN